MNVVLTTLLTSEIDPMRGRKWAPDSSILETWENSVRPANAFVIADELREAPGDATLISTSTIPVDEPPSGGPYFNRWIYSLYWLRKMQEHFSFVWITDGSDVVMLRPPWREMRSRVLYVGSEDQVVGCDWMSNPNHHPTRSEQWFVNDHREDRLFNAGLVGGDVATVIDFLSMLYLRWREAGRPAMSDMAIFNATLYTEWPGWIETGEQVHTTFGAHTDNGKAWWKHK